MDSKISNLTLPNLMKAMRAVVRFEFASLRTWECLAFDLGLLVEEHLKSPHSFYWAVEPELTSIFGTAFQAAKHAYESEARSLVCQVYRVAWDADSETYSFEQIN